eukprot:3583906-Amphidinium_carterae.1
MIQEQTRPNKHLNAAIAIAKNKPIASNQELPMAQNPSNGNGEVSRKPTMEKKGNSVGEHLPCQVNM